MYGWTYAPGFRRAFRVLLALASIAVNASAQGPATPCKTGFVPREARPADRICVTPASKARVARENARTPLLWTPGLYGPKTCPSGFVWREAFAGDLTCVTPDIRAVVRDENATAASRHQ
jgi:hypothetical protein